MKAALILTSIVLAGCTSLSDITPSAEGQSNSQLETFTLYGTASQPEQSRHLPMSLRDAIKVAGGLRNCDECFKRGGEAFLWERAGIAKVRRGDVILDVQPKDFNTFIVKPNDFIYISHKF